MSPLRHYLQVVRPPSMSPVEGRADSLREPGEGAWARGSLLGPRGFDPVWLVVRRLPEPACRPAADDRGSFDPGRVGRTIRALRALPPRAPPPRRPGTASALAEFLDARGGVFAHGPRQPVSHSRGRPRERHTRVAPRDWPQRGLRRLQRVDGLASGSRLCPPIRRSSSYGRTSRARPRLYTSRLGSKASASTVRTRRTGRPDSRSMCRSRTPGSVSRAPTGLPSRERQA